MEVRIHRTDATADLAGISQRIQDADPAAVIDVEAGSEALRISTVMGTSELLSALHEGGLDVSAMDIVHLPSACCGGCGG
jgi:hypothetical protein